MQPHIALAPSESFKPGHTLMLWYLDRKYQKCDCAATCMPYQAVQCVSSAPDSRALRGCASKTKEPPRGRYYIHHPSSSTRILVGPLHITSLSGVLPIFAYYRIVAPLQAKHHSRIRRKTKRYLPYLTMLATFQFLWGPNPQASHHDAGESPEQVTPLSGEAATRSADLRDSGFGSFICKVSYLEDTLRSGNSASVFRRGGIKASNRVRVGDGRSFLVDRAEVKGPNGSARTVAVKTVKEYSLSEQK